MGQKRPILALRNYAMAPNNKNKKKKKNKNKEISFRRSGLCASGRISPKR